MTLEMEVEVQKVPEISFEDMVGKYMVVDLDRSEGMIFHGLYADEKEALREANMKNRYGFRVMKR